MKNILLLSLTFITLVTTSCKKWQHQYPEDTERTKLTPTERLTDKWWTLVSTTLNGQDYNDTIKQQFGKYQIMFGKNQDGPTLGTNVVEYAGIIETDIEQSFSIAWSVHDENNISIVPFDGNYSNKKSIIPGYLKHGPYLYQLFTILKLSQNELKISINTKDNDSLIVHYFKTL